MLGRFSHWIYRQRTKYNFIVMTLYFLMSAHLLFQGGEPLLGIPAVIRYPFFDEATSRQLFPHRTVLMLLSIAVQLAVSAGFKFAFAKQYLSPRHDIFHCFKQKESETIEHQPGAIEMP